ncbi:Dipeptidyl carboxypeptidase Dcp, partial [hydrothermal vent metagenome]
MKLIKNSRWLIGLSLGLAVTSLVTTHALAQEAVPQKNPLLAEWSGPFGGVPAFDQMDLKDVPQAFDVAIAENLADYEKIANNPEPATFENTIVAMEKAGEKLSRAFTYFGIWGSNLSSPDVRQLQMQYSPKFSEMGSKISQNKKLFARVKKVYEDSLKTPFKPEAQRLVNGSYEGFAMSGANLDEFSKKRYAAINKELSSIYTTFGNNVLHDEEGYVTFVHEKQLSGLPESLVKSAAQAAKDKSMEGHYAITNTRSSMDPFLTYSDERELRKKVWTNYYSRGDNGGEYDNNENIAKILKLRRERVELLGHKNYPEWRLQNRMAKTPENAMNLMEAVWPAAIARVKEEVTDMQDVADELGHGITIEPWDYRYYAEKVRKKKYDLDSNEVKQYLQLDNLREAMFYVAGELFNFKFTALADGKVPVYHPDVKVWEVNDKTTGAHIGLWYLDPFARQGKRSGAWATAY